MTDPTETMLSTFVEGEHLLHRELWRVVERQLDYATNNATGAFYDDMVAMVFAFHTLEAYLNFVGEHLAPEIWNDERSFFQKASYRGFDGKVRKVLELVGHAEPDRGTRPYSTVWLLKTLRDRIAHAHPERFARTIVHSEDQQPDFYSTSLTSLITHENAEMSRSDIEIFIESIHTDAKAKTEDVWFGKSALSGALQYSSGHRKFL